MGILVDEATVEIENIHTQLGHSDSIARAVCLGNAQTAVPRLLAMLCILAVFVPSFFMEGAARELFVPLSMAVGFAMIASYLLSSTFVPVLSTWLLRHAPHEAESDSGWFSFARVRSVYERLLGQLVGWRLAVIGLYLVASAAAIGLVGSQTGIEIFPTIDAGEFRLRMRGPDGTHIDHTEQLALRVLDIVKENVGEQNIRLTLGYVGTVPSTYPINGVYQWSRGPEEAILRIALKPHSGVSSEAMKEVLRNELAARMPGVRFSFEPADIVSEVMSFGSPTPIEVATRGMNLKEDREYILKLQAELKKLPALRDVQVSQTLDYPTIDVQIDREKAGRSGATVGQVTRSVVAATSSSRFVVPNFWPDPKSGIGYQVQVEIPQPVMNSLDDLATVPVQRVQGQQLLLRDIARITPGTMPGQYDRYNMKREISLTANISGADLGSVSRQITHALARVEKTGEKPAGMIVDVRGQIPAMRQMMSGLGVGMILAVLVIFLLLTANFQSLRLAFVTVSSAPAVIAGVLLALYATRSTLNIESVIGAIMAVGVAMANGILLVTFAEHRRQEGATSLEAAISGAASRLRPILMTSCAMIAGMIPMAVGLGESGQQTAPLGRAVIGGLAAATFATLFIVPSIFALVQGRATTKSASLHPDDPESVYFGNTTPGS